MYSFESSGSRRPLHAMVIASMAAAVILFSISNREGIAMPYLYQLGAMICLTAMIYLLGRYSLRLYRYAIEPNGIVDACGEEQYDLVITEIVGKRMTVVSRVALRSIDREGVTVIRRGDDRRGDDRRGDGSRVDGSCGDGQTAKERAAALRRGRRVFRYENTPVSPASCYIPLPEENALVIIPVDARMLEILKKE